MIRSHINTITAGGVYRPVVILTSGVVLGWMAISLEPFRFVGGMIAVLGGLLALIRPELAILGVVAATSSIIPDNATPKLPFLAGSFRGYDLLLLFLLALAAIHSLTAHPRNVLRTALDLPLILFLAAAVVSLYRSTSAPGIDPSTALQEFRRLAYYLLFFAVTRLITRRRQVITLIRGLVLISVVVAAAMVTEALAGTTLDMIPGTLLGGAGTGKVETRMILVFVMFAVLMAMAVFEDGKGLQGRRLLPAGLMAAAIILTYGRNLWAAAVVVLGLLTWLLGPGKRSKMVVLASITLGAVLIIVLPLTAVSERSTEVVESVTNLAMSLITGEQNTLDLRVQELQYATGHILENPIFGIGLGGSYRPPIWKGDTGTGAHNTYLWIQVKLGAVGLISFLWFSVLFLGRGFRHWKEISDPYLRTTLLGFTLGYLGLMLSSLVTNRFAANLVGPTTFGLITGISEVIIRTTRASAVVQNRDPVREPLAAFGRVKAETIHPIEGSS